MVWGVSMKDAHLCRGSTLAAAASKTMSIRRSRGRPAARRRNLQLVAKNEDLNVPAPLARAGGHDAEHGAEDEVQKTEQHGARCYSALIDVAIGVSVPLRELMYLRFSPSYGRVPNTSGGLCNTLFTL